MDCLRFKIKPPGFVPNHGAKVVKSFGLAKKLSPSPLSPSPSTRFATFKRLSGQSLDRDRCRVPDSRSWFDHRPIGSQRRLQNASRRAVGRKGQASIDYVLLLAVILPLVLFMFTVVPRMIQLVYEFTVTLIGMPFM